MKEILPIYHRGLRAGGKDKEPQVMPNSFEALLCANKGDTLEMDIFLLDDGALAIVHQKDLELSEQDVEKMSIREFEKLDNPKKISESDNAGIENGKKMPLFDEVLGLSCDRGVKVQFELKASSVKQIKKLADIFIDKMISMREQGVFAINSRFLDELSFFSMSVEGMQYIVEKFKEKGIEASTFLSWPSSEEYAKDMEISKTAIQYARDFTGSDWSIKGMKIAKKIGCKGISIRGTLLVSNPEYVKKAHELGLEVMAGGIISSEEDIKKLRNIGVDRFMSEILE